ncbi:hypothetical protein [Pseudomonas sp. ML96]|uniref:hypothetical protein n=1 Tax=Pseudomonas sp. ML96 TaxID=1523503 RepID=UPI0012E0AD70|nr:hypothetical protein [Pseudomonas sp. ML96]
MFDFHGWRGVKVFVIVVISVFLSSCERMMWVGGNYWDLYINDFNLAGGQVEILMSRDYVYYEGSIMGHQGRSEVVRGELYSTGRLSFSSLFTDNKAKIAFYKVGEKSGELPGLYLSEKYPRSIMVRDWPRICEKYKGKCGAVVLKEKKADEYPVLRMRLQESEGLVHIEYQSSSGVDLVKISRSYVLKDSDKQYELRIVK